MKKILFVCVENAGRSQMADGFFRKYLPKGFESISAGTKPSGKVNPMVIQVMKEVGIDISKQSPKSISNDMIKDSKIVNMGCMDKESCPALFLESVDDWNITDPKDKPIEQVREIRDQIENKVKEFVSNLEIN